MTGVSTETASAAFWSERGRFLVHSARVGLLRFVLITCACMMLGEVQAGQFGLATSNTAPALIADGHRDDLLRIVVSNPGAGGVPDVELTSLGLRLESAPGTALSAAHSSNVVNALELYSDSNGSGTFELGQDVLIGTVIGPAPAADGTVSFPFSNTDPAAIRISAGQSRTYFLIVRLTGNGSAQTPRTLRVTHLTSGPGSSTARESGTGIGLTLQPVADVSSGMVTAQSSGAPTTSGIANVFVSEPAIATSIPLFAAFQDAEDTPAQMRYEISAISNTGLFAATGIDPGTGILSLAYKTGTVGRSWISVRATDRTGKSVTGTFEVVVGLLSTYGDWAAFYFGSGNPAGSAVSDDLNRTGLSNLAKYAFGLHSHIVGDRAGLPRAGRSDNARILTHLRPKYATDLAYTYEISSNLQTWRPALRDVDFHQRDKDLLDGRVRVELLLLRDSPTAFLRARVSQTAAGPPPTIGSGAAFTAPPTLELLEVPAPAAPGAGATSTSTAGQVSPGTAVFPQQSVLTTAATYANWVVTADIDGDGNRDVVSASLTDNKVALYRNTGDGTFAPQHVITTANIYPSTVAAADLDGDGKPDLVTGSFDKLAWHKNVGGGNFGPQQVILPGFTAASSVSAPDLDNDGKPDLLCSSLDAYQVSWHKNLGGGAFGPQQIIGAIGQPNTPYQVAAADIDGDGFPDVVSASTNDNKISWHRNQRDGTFGPQQVISTSVVRASTVASEDFDGDGRADVICGGANDNTVSFFRNNGNGTFAPRLILSSSAMGVFSVIAADLNGDGAPDVVSASLSDNKIAWYQNLGAGTFGPQQIISTNAMGAISVTSGDLNGDGKVDVASASQNDSKVAVYLNTGVSGGGQVAVATMDTAPTGIVEGSSRSILRVNVSNRRPAGGNSVQLARLAFLLESSPGVPLNAAQASGIIDRLQFYADTNGSGLFEPGADSLLQTASYLPIGAGRVQLPLSSASPELPVPPGTARTYFVVVQIKPDATSETPATFRITHVTEGQPRSIAKDSLTGLPVFIGPVGNTASSLVTALANQRPVSTGIPSVTVFDTVDPTAIPLLSHFNDAEDGASGLKFAITGNTNPGLFSFVGINPVTRVLTIRYRSGFRGAAQLTVRGTDTLGKSVSTTFTVNVAVITSFADWTSLYGGSGPTLFAGPSANFLRYAFALNPASSGDASRLPLMYSDGRTRVLSHLKYRYASDLAYQYEISTDLQNWSVARNGTHYYEFTTDLANGLQQTDLIILVDWPRAFFRPRATVIP